MPLVQFRGAVIECDRGAVLRDVLREAGLSPHNGHSTWLNCLGGGSCGTCAVLVEGPVTYRTRKERLRLRFPPHDPEAGLRLACQTLVLGNLRVEKYPGFWGQRVSEEPLGPVDDTFPGESVDGRDAADGGDCGDGDASEST